MKWGPVYRGLTMWPSRPLALAVALLAMLSSPADAATPTAELRAFFAEATLILTDPRTEGKNAERLLAIRAITRQIFDVREASRLALGSAWNERTPAERERFVELYADLLERAFIAWIAARAQMTDGPRVTFLGESVDDGHATVRTTVLGRTGQEVSLDYRMVERGDRWAVRDVVIDGVGLAANYRAQFARVIQTSSYAGLVRELERRRSAPPVAVASATGRSTIDAAAPLPTPASQGHPPVQDTAQTPAPPTPRLVAVAPSDATAPPLAVAGLPSSRPAIYWVQVAAFKNQHAALRLAALLGSDKTPDRSAEPWMVVVTPAPEVSRVRIGPFADRAEAELSLRRLEARGFKPFIAEDRQKAR
jgi:phospholipid transport system substrate-binding protein